MYRGPFLVACACFGCLFCPWAVQGQDASEIVFSRDILPILSDHCFQCHGPDEKAGREGDLRLDEEIDVKRDRGGYAVIVESSAEESELIQRVTAQDADSLMPPPELGRPLSERQITLLSRWIDAGALWGKHWSFEPITRPPLDLSSASHPVDALVQKQLQRVGWERNPPASRETLIRRLSLDLRGFPPTPDEVQEFLDDQSPDAWETLVDRFLESDAFGERMAWDWMEVARYADSNGYQGDGERTMWPWRDWVVRAFNSNLPFDQFTIWQLAGDLLPGATEEQVLATGFCRNYMINGEGGRIAEENRVDYVMDMTETMGTAWLGLTLNCCRCHDHKFDPILNREYYQLSAFFNQTPVDGGGGNPQTPPVIVVSTPSEREVESEHEQYLEELQQRIDARRQFIRGGFKQWVAAQLANADVPRWNLLRFNSMHSDRGQEFSVTESGVVKTSGENPSNDTYTLTHRFKEPTRLGAVLLESVRDATMTAGGFARSDSGNFVLTELEISIRESAEATWRDLTIKTANATFEQGDFKVTAAFDGVSTTGWAVYEGKPATKNQAAIFRLSEVQSLPSEAELRIVLRHDSQHVKHNLGSFRLSVGDRPDALFPDEDDSIAALLVLEETKRTAEQKEKIQKAFEATDNELVELLDSQRSVSSQLASLRASYPRVMVMGERASPRPTFILDRGLYSEPGEEVQADTPSFLPPLLNEGPRDRLALAQWLVAPENPLTARVAVNRFWQTFFGRGLVKTSEDFGIQAEYPVQRELLDWLAAEFRDSGWDVKHLIRTILTSAMYQQTSDIVNPEVFEADPENRYLTRAPRFRMPSWMIRDSALAVSGLLNTTVGGKPVFPYQPEGVWAEATFGNKRYREDTGEALYRRSLYTFWRRIVGPTMFFDTAKRQVCEVKPLRTNTPLHALTTLNDVTYVEAARALAAFAVKQVPATTDTQSREEVEAGEPNVKTKFVAERLEFVYRRVLARKPTQAELVIWNRSFDKAYASFSSSMDDTSAFLQMGQYRADETIPPVELAAWTAVCLNLLNLDESLTRE